jgi:uncharacterized BrkB/YihY/UPF0761 family membrane protein
MARHRDGRGGDRIAGIEKVRTIPFVNFLRLGEMESKMFKSHAREFWSVSWGACGEWTQDKVPRMAAALAFYTIFSLTPIVVIAVAIGGTFFGPEAALQEMVRQVNFLVGPSGGEAINLLVSHASSPRRSSPWESRCSASISVIVQLARATVRQDHW